MKRILSILMVITTVFTLAACQAAPEKPIVVKKDTERMIEKADQQEGGTPLDTLGIPLGRYTYEATGANERLHINVDAVVQKPNVTAMPIVKASMGLFTQEMTTGIFHYLFPDEKPYYDPGQVETKADIEKELLEMKKKLAEGSYESYTEKEYKEMITFLEAAYHAAPETTPEKAISDGTLQTVGKNADGMPLLSLGVSTKNKRLRVTTVPNSKALSGLTLPGIIFSRESPTYFTNGMASFSATDLSDTVKEKLIISYDDAKLLCDDFFKAAGMSNDFCVGATFVLNDIGDYERPAQNYAYRFYYTRIYNSIPLHFNIQGSYKEDESFSLPWYYEDVQITVDNDGIVDIIWIYPIEIGQTVNEAATLKPFVEIMEIFETMIKTIYESAVLTPETVESNVAFESGGNKTSAIKCIDIDVNEIKLCLIRIREKNADQTEGLLVPAWVFYGHNMATDEAGNISYRLGASDINATVRKDVPVALMAINAVDGSVIDLSKGY